MNKYNAENTKGQGKKIRKNENCWYVATRLLGIRPRSVEELKKKLLDKKFSEPEVNDTINTLLDLKYLNDKEFAQMVCESTLAGKPKGRAALRFKLKKYLVPEKVIKETLEKILTQEKEEEYCRKAFDSKKKTLKNKSIDNFKERQKIFGYLIRQGFSTDVVYKVIGDFQ